MKDEGKSEGEFRAALRDWIVALGKVGPSGLADDTPVIERRIVTSVQVMDLILFLEELLGEPIDVETLKPGSFRSIDAIVANFYPGARRA